MIAVDTVTIDALALAALLLGTASVAVLVGAAAGYYSALRRKDTER